MQTTSSVIGKDQMVLFREPSRSGILAVGEGGRNLCVRQEDVISLFPIRRCFVQSTGIVRMSMVGPEYPVSIFYRLQGRGLITIVPVIYEDIWKKWMENLQTILLYSISERMKKIEHGQFFTDIEGSGVLIADANKIASDYHIPIVVVGVGRVICEDCDPFDLPKN